MIFLPRYFGVLAASRSVRGADTVGQDARGYDTGNHAGRAVMPGWPCPAGVGAVQLG